MDKEIKNELNLHEIILELKKYLYKAEKIQNIEELDITISEVKKFIFKNPILKNEYENKIKQFQNFNKKHKNLGIIIQKLIIELIKKENKNNNINTLNEFLSKPEIYYFPLLKELIKDTNIVTNNCIINFYKNLIDRYFLSKMVINIKVDLFFKNKKVKQLVEFVDFTILAFEDFVIITKSPFLANDIFFQRWLLSALNGVLHELLNIAKTKLIQKKDITSIGSFNKVQLNILNTNMNSLSAKQKKVFEYLRNGYSIRNIAQILNIEESTVRTHVSSICAKLKLEKTNLRTLLEYILQNNNSCDSTIT